MERVLSEKYKKTSCDNKYILGIESSCDDTGIALILGDEIVANTVLKQEHKKGVIPEYAARAHHVALFEHSHSIIQDFSIDLIAYTSQPGLIGSLFVGANFAKSLAYTLGVPSIGINHLVGHILLPYWLDRNAACNVGKKICFPYLCLLVSGGHTMIILVENVGQYKILATTLDDAVGEVFDKVARNIGLDYPGGPHIEQLASIVSESSYSRQSLLDEGCDMFMQDKRKYKFPFVMKNRQEFSFSGLKTAAIEQITNDAAIEDKAQFCRDFQDHVAFLLAQKMQQVHNQLQDSGYDLAHWVVSGGVAANKTIRAKLDEVSLACNAQVHYPPVELCTDNGVMIACVGQLMFDRAISQNLDEMLSKKPNSISNL